MESGKRCFSETGWLCRKVLQYGLEEKNSIAFFTLDHLNSYKELVCCFFNWIVGVFTVRNTFNQSLKGVSGLVQIESCLTKGNFSVTLNMICFHTSWFMVHYPVGAKKHRCLILALLEHYCVFVGRAIVQYPTDFFPFLRIESNVRYRAKPIKIWMWIYVYPIHNCFLSQKESRLKSFDFCASLA